MAQYGRNFYGASHYDISGVMTGQFISDKAGLKRPIIYNPAVGSDGTITFDITARLQWAYYSYKDSTVSFPPEESNWEAKKYEDLIRYFGTWEDAGESYYSSVIGSKVKIDLTCSDFVLRLTKRSDGADIKVTLVNYLKGAPVEGSEIIIECDTKEEDEIKVEDLPFGEWRVEIEVVSEGVFEYSGFNVISTDVALDLKNTLSHMDVKDDWSGWNKVPLTRTFIGDKDNRTETRYIDTPLYFYTAKTANLEDTLAYQFKLLLATSDDKTTPEILELDLHTGNTEYYAQEGYWKMLIDLGESFGSSTEDSVEAVTYNARGSIREGEEVAEEGWVVEIRSRTTEDNAVETEVDSMASWDYWTVPYSDAPIRALIDLRDINFDTINNNKIKNGYLVESILSPLYSPENLTHWIDAIPQYYVNHEDPITGEIYNGNKASNGDTIRGSYMEIEFLTEDQDPISKDGRDFHKFIIDTQYYTHYDMDKIRIALSQIIRPMRVKVTFYVKVDSLTKYPLFGTPVIENIHLESEAEYIELRKFGNGSYNPNFYREDTNRYYWETQKNIVMEKYKGVGSAVFNGLTGEDYIYKDGLTRNSLADVGSFLFQIPVGAENPDYYIEEINQDDSMTSNMEFYWEDSKEDVTGKQDDRLIIKVRPNGTSINIHRHFGSGETLKIENLEKNHNDKHSISNIYYPALNFNKINAEQYAYHLQNGFDDPETRNNRVEIRWDHENFLNVLPSPEHRSPWYYRRNIAMSFSQPVLASITSARKGGLKRWVSEELILNGIVNNGSPVMQSSDNVPPRESEFRIHSDETLPSIPSNVIIVDTNPYKAEVILDSVISNEDVKEEKRITLNYETIKLKDDVVRVDDAKFIRGKSSEDFLFRNSTTIVHNIKDAKTGAMYARGTHYSQNKLTKKVDWSIGIDNRLTIPKEGDELLMSYSYKPFETLTVLAKSNYSTMHYDLANIYKTNVLKYSASCKVGIDYTSPKYFIDSLWSKIPNTVDKTTLKLKVKVLDNERINAYIQDNSVIGTLGMINPKENWNPSIQKGFYSIGKEDYFMYTGTDTYTFDNTKIPIAKNIEYVDGIIDQAILSQKGTSNLLTNNDLIPNKILSLSLWDDIEYVWTNEESTVLGLRPDLKRENNILLSSNAFYSNERRCEIRAKYISNYIDKGVVLWYNNEIGHLAFIVDNTIARVERKLHGDTVIYDTKNIVNMEIEDGTPIEIRVTVDSDKYEFFINDELIMELYDSTFSEGFVGLYGDVKLELKESEDPEEEAVEVEIGTNLIEYSILTEGLDDWGSTLTRGSSISNYDGFVNIRSNEPSYISQTIELDANTKYSISGKAKFDPFIEVVFNEEPLTYKSYQGEILSTLSFETNEAGLYEIRVGAIEGERAFLDKLQVEKKAYSTSYTKSTRPDSILTFPSPDFNTENGSVSFWFKMVRDYSEDELTFFYLNKDMNLKYCNGVITFKYGEIEVILEKDLDVNGWYYISCIWNDQDLLIINIYDNSDQEDYLAYELEVSKQTIVPEKKVYILCDNITSSDGILGSLLIYKNQVDKLSTLQEHMRFKHVTNQDVLMQASFNKSTLNYDENRVTIPIVRIDTPIIVKAIDGTILERVYFTEKWNLRGDLIYTTTCRETLDYDPKGTYKLLYDDILDCKVYLEEYDTRMPLTFELENGYIKILNELNEEHSKRPITIEYSVKDSYCINYVEGKGQYELQFSNMNGSEYSIHAEGMQSKDKNLMKTIEMNPFKGTNGSGFIYVEDTPRTLETFDVKITPDSLVANGHDTATIVIDCYSRTGINTSNVDLKVSSSRGFADNTIVGTGLLPKYMDQEETTWNNYKEEYGEEAAIARYGNLITDEHRAGRFIYKYKARGMSKTDDSPIEVIDNVLIYDELSGIGIKVPIRLIKEGVSY